MSSSEPSHFKCVEKDFEEHWNIIQQEFLRPLFHGTEHDSLQREAQLEAHERVKKICFLHPDLTTVKQYCEDKLRKYIKSYTLNYYKHSLLPQLNRMQTSKILIARIHHEWHLCEYVISTNFGSHLSFLDERLSLRHPQGGYQSLDNMAKECFKTVVYKGLSNRLRELCYSSLSCPLPVPDVPLLEEFFNLLKCISDYNKDFCVQEWDSFLCERLFERMNAIAQPTVEHSSLQDFIQNAHRQIESFSCMCISDDSRMSLKRSFLKKISESRERVLFGNGQAQLRKLLKERRFEDWKRIFTCFGGDRDFINKISKFLSIYSQKVEQDSFHCNIYGLRAAEEVFQWMFKVWGKLEGILRNGIPDSHGIDDIASAIKKPFQADMEFLGNKFNLEYQVAKHFDCLLSRTNQENQLLPVHRSEELQILVSFVEFLSKHSEFNEYYRQNLVSRLLAERYDNLKMELEVVEGLRKEFSRDANLLQSIIQDASMWQEKQLIIANWMKFHSSPLIYGSIHSDPRMIRQSQWPEIPDTALQLPKEIRSIMDVYMQYFCSQHPNQNVRAHCCAGEVILKSDVWRDSLSRPVRIKLTTGQMCILSLFEDREQMAVVDILAKLKDKCGTLNNPKEARKARHIIFKLLESMMTKNPVLCTSSGKLDFEDDQIVWLNLNYVPRSNFIHLSSPDFFSGGDEGTVDISL